jgi:hypothetical protein
VGSFEQQLKEVTRTRPIGTDGQSHVSPTRPYPGRANERAIDVVVLPMRYGLPLLESYFLAIDVAGRDAGAAGGRLVHLREL